VRVLDRKTNRELDLPYDRLIIATGARSRKLGIPGEAAENIFTLKNMADGIRLRGFIDRQRPKRAVIIGAGYISLEVAEALRERGVETTILYRGEYPYSGLEPELGPIIVDELKARGVAFVGRVTPQAFSTHGAQAVQVETDQGPFPADLFFVGVGIQPNSEIAREAGIVLGETGGIQVNDRMLTNDPLIFSAGDCCEKFHRVTGKPVVVPLGDIANKEGRVAGENAVGGRSQFHGIVGAACVKIFNLEIGQVGISEVLAKRLGYPAISQVVEAGSRVGIYPGDQHSLLKIVADSSTGKILGGNWIGRDGEARKINTLAVALYNEMTLEQISRLDLAYAPPFSPVWDPLLIAANLLKRKVHP
jgi:NADPH-dependent 2,4-dienoyl-CoA reductase/sulfur reductase-like enzyme